MKQLITLLNRSYDGHESMQDWDKDMGEIPNDPRLPDNFTGAIIVQIRYLEEEKLSSLIKRCISDPRGSSFTNLETYRIEEHINLLRSKEEDDAKLTSKK